MAERRMFAQSVLCSDAFTELPAKAQLLYIHLNFAADDDGFCDCPRQVMNKLKARNSEMLMLVKKKFVLIFDGSPVVCVKHWRLHNQIRKDRYKPTKYQNLLALLYYDENKSYSQNPVGHTPCLSVMATNGCQTDNQMGDIPATQVRLGKDSIGKDNIKENNSLCINTRTREETVYPDIGEDGVKSLEQQKVMDIYVKMMREDLQKGRSIDPILRLVKAKGMDADELERRARSAT